EWEACFEAWRVIVCSGFMAGELGGYFNVPLDKTSVIPNGIDPAPLQECPAEEIEGLRQRYAPNGEKLLFFVGRITPEKGLHILLRAMPHILPHFPHVRLLVAGKNSEQMQPLLQELKIAHAVHLLGFISDQARNCLYNLVDAAIFPSLYEPFGIVALEAMAAGCNVIVSDVGGLSEVVHHMHNGLTVIANNSQSIAWGVDMLFEDAERAAEWRGNALNDAQLLYRWPDIADRTYELYKSVVEERRHVEW
ncbi:MAG: glycosyltransferase family 4 protein, partial [Caldilineaceae bacterium]